MRSFALLTVLAAPALIAGQKPPANITTGVNGDAPIINNNPAGARYTATFPATGGNISGTVTASSASNGTGVVFSVNLTGLPASAGPPFPYHLHVAPLPAGGNCSTVLAHLDPFRRGQFPDTPMCDPTKPQTCEVGDLSGKHGNITSLSWQQSYTEFYASTVPSIGAFFGNRSIVIHRSDGTRLACANWISG